ncbi:MAG: hypothetical protein ACOYN3_04240 [Acidimicrobiia bacterium]
MSEVFDQDAFTEIIDRAIQAFAGRELIHAAEVTDVLLDLRLTVLGNAAAVDPLADLLGALGVSQ